MAERDIDLGRFDFDVDEVIKEMAKLKDIIEDLSEVNRDLRKEGEAGTAQFVTNEILIKSSRKEYNALNKIMSEHLTTQAESSNRGQLIALALQEEVLSIKMARDQNKVLNGLRNSANLLTAEGREELEKLNQKLDQNNEFIKENVDQYTKQKINIGNYKNSIVEAFEELNIFNGGLFAFIGRAQAAGGVGIHLSNSFKAIRVAILGMTKASIAFMLTPIGAVIAALALTVGLLISYFKGTQEGMDAVTSVTRPLMEVWQTLIGITQELGKALVDAFKNPKKAMMEIVKVLQDTVIKAFTGYLKLLQGIATLNWDKAKEGLSQMGEGATNAMNKAKKSVTEYGARLQEAIERGKQIDKMQKSLDKTEATFIQNQSSLKAQIKEQNLIAENTNLTVKEREAATLRTIELNREVNKQQTERLNLEADILKLKTKSNDTSDAEKVEIAKKLAEIDDKRTAMLELETTQNNKLNQIRKQGVDEYRKRLGELASQQSAELELYLQGEGTKSKTMEKQLEIAEETARRKVEIAKAEYAATEKTELDKLELQVKLNEAEEERLSTQREIAVAEAEFEFELFRSTLDRKLNENARFSEEWLAQERERNELQFDAEKKLAETKLEQGLINQVEFDALMQELKAQQQFENDETQKEYDQAKEDERVATEIAKFDLKMEKMRQDNALTFDIEREQNNQNYRRGLEDLQTQLANKQISNERYLAEKEALEVAHSNTARTIAEKEQQAKVDVVQAGLGAIQSIVGKASAVGKAAAVASSLINTYQGVTKALAEVPPPFSYVQAGITAAMGMKSVADILKTKVPGSEGGGSMGGLTNASSLSNSFAGASASGQGINMSQTAASGNRAVQQDINRQADNDQLVASVSEAVRQGSREGTREGSTEGITTARETSAIANSSNF